MSERKVKKTFSIKLKVLRPLKGNNTKMKKKTNVLKIFMSCLLPFYMMLTHWTITSSAVEVVNKSEINDIYYNSVVVIESYSIDEGYIQAGKNANITMTLRNVNNDSTAHFIVLDFHSNSGMIYPAYGTSNQVYVSSIKSNESVTISIPILVSSDFTGNFADMVCTLEYESGGAKIINSSTIALPSESTNSIVVKGVEVSASAKLNGKSLVSIAYNNNSNDSINDAELIIEGNVTEATKNIKLDSIGVKIDTLTEEQKIYLNS